MEGSPESGVDLAILGLTRCHLEEEDGRARQRYVERGKGTHHIWFYLSDDSTGGKGKDSAHN